MRIDFTLTNGTKSYLLYPFFKIRPACSNYQLSISGYKGNDIDLIIVHTLNGRPFTTKDRDNDNWYDNCAVSHKVFFKVFPLIVFIINSIAVM